MKANLCSECKNYTTYEYWRYTEITCNIGHKPRFYMPRNGNPHDERAGHKRKCDDFKTK